MKKIIEKLQLRDFQKKIFLLIFRYSFFLFPFIWSLTFFFSILESFTYSGFIRKHIFFGFQFFLFFMILCGLLIKFGLPIDKKTKREWIDYYKVLGLLNNIFFPLILAATIIASAVEESHYPNYVFSKIHLQPKNLYWVCFVSFYLIILKVRNLEKIGFLFRVIIGKKMVPFLILNYFRKAVLLALIFWILIFNARFASAEIFKNLLIITRHPLATYDEKMRIVWGDFYNYMLFIKRNTPEDATIANPPPIPPWNNEGSGPVFNAFLYPRKFFQSITEDMNEVDLKADYALIAWGSYRCSKNDVGPDDEFCHGWPRIHVEAEWIIYKKENSSEIDRKINDIIYDPNDPINKYAWGLIKIKKK